MLDISKTVAPKSDQLNADDLIGQSKTIKIRKIIGNESADQPISIYFDGDDNKPYKPCKSMRRVLLTIWGSNGDSYVGKSMTLFRDDSVVFGGISVGGIRISHMSDMEKAKEVALTVTRGKRKPYIVQPLGELKAKAKESLTPEHSSWDAAKSALKSGVYTMESIKKKYELSAENEALILSTGGAE